MIENIQIVGLAASLISCAFWLAGAGVRFKPLSLFRLTGPESIPAALQKQSLLNAFAAIFAAVAAGSQATIYYLQIAN